MQQVFPSDRQVLIGKFRSCFEDKCDSAKFYKLRINKKQTAYDLVKLFP